MRSEKEMMDLVLSLAEQDERIRIVTLEGSRANINIPKKNDLEFMEEVLIDDNMVFDIDNLKGFLNDTSSFGFIAKENNKIIGFAYCYTLLRPDGKTMFYLHSIGMLPNYQDKGYGSKLLSFIKEYSKEIGCSEMFLITDKGNPRACHVYEKLGGKNDYKDEIVYVYDYGFCCKVLNLLSNKVE
ncbi:GNAT family N-acetyltransferase [Streptococcus agalactiae]|nr:GNAT family N-acetyltransferase [Streptococcus agalactiae]